MFVIAGLCWYAAVPQFGHTGFINANESAAIATLKNIASGQRVVQERAQIDRDGDGVGEFGYLGELSGRVPIRGSDRRVDPPVLSAQFGNVVDGCATRSAYCFGMFLPGDGGRWLPESPSGGASGRVLPDLAEEAWLLYAWPVHYGERTRRRFVIDAAGDVHAHTVQRVPLRGIVPMPGLTAFCERDGRWQLAHDERDAFGDLWVIVQ